VQRFALYGDTVNYASRMESTSVSMKIHVSEATAEKLKNLGYLVKYRGRVFVKGKGLLNTFWLEGGPPKSKPETKNLPVVKTSSISFEK
jgi:class 3 adenylate cyclase